MSIIANIHKEETDLIDKLHSTCGSPFVPITAETTTIVQMIFKEMVVLEKNLHALYILPKLNSIRLQIVPKVNLPLALLGFLFC